MVTIRKTKIDCFDKSLERLYTDFFIIRKSIDVATKFRAVEKETKQKKILEKCKLIENKQEEVFKLLFKNNLGENSDQYYNLIKYDDFLIKSTFAYFISTKNDAMDLFDYLYNMKKSNQSLEADKAGNIVCQIANGVEFLHKLIIVHSYLNTTDIYIDSNEFVKIGGFYFAEKLDENSPVSNETERKFFYNCPADEKRQITLKYDIWCIGWILYEVCTLTPMKSVLDNVDFNNFHQPTLPEKYKQLEDTFINLSQIDKNKRKPLTTILKDNDFLKTQFNNYKNRLDKMKFVGKTLKHDSLSLIIQKLLGNGSNGVTYKCFNETDKSIKAIKLLSEIADETQQAEILKSLVHKNIAMYFDYFRIGTQYYLVTEYCNGGDLDKYIVNMKEKKEIIPNERILDWSRQLFEALSYIHSIKVMHRDLNPRNVMLNYDENSEQYLIKLIDFGWSKQFEKTLSKASTCCGTSCYMAPEVSNQHYDFKADVWSAGCIVYELSELQKAYVVKINETTLSPVNSTPFIKQSNIMKEVLKKTFEYEFLKRPSSKEIFDILSSMKDQN